MTRISRAPTYLAPSMAKSYLTSDYSELRHWSSLSDPYLDKGFIS